MTCNSFSIEKAPESDRKDLLSELELMKKLKPHPHVIKLIGCVTESGNESSVFLLFIDKYMSTRLPQ